MHTARRSALRASRTVRRHQKRDYSGNHSDHQHTVDQPHPVEHANTTEHLGPRFFLALSALPVGFLFYDYTTSDPQNPPFLTKHLQTYESWGKEWQRRNDLHTRAVQQAAEDKLLFRSAEPSRMIDLKFPEQFNAGSPFANVAGHRADLTELVQHYQKNNEEMEQKVANKTQEQRDNCL